MTNIETIDKTREYINKIISPFIEENENSLLSIIVGGSRYLECNSEYSDIDLIWIVKDKTSLDLLANYLKNLKLKVPLEEKSLSIDSICFVIYDTMTYTSIWVNEEVAEKAMCYEFSRKFWGSLTRSQYTPETDDFIIYEKESGFTRKWLKEEQVWLKDNFVKELKESNFYFIPTHGKILNSLYYAIYLYLNNLPLDREYLQQLKKESKHNFAVVEQYDWYKQTREQIRELIKRSK